MTLSCEETKICLDSLHATEPVTATAKEDNEPDFLQRLENLQKHDANLESEMSTSSKWRYEQEAQEQCRICSNKASGALIGPILFKLAIQLMQKCTMLFQLT